MRLQDDLDFTTLNWVKQELDETLKQARQALEQYVEDPADSSLMRFCATYLHQVQGTLRMVELYGAAMVVEEMERVASGLLDNQIRQREEAYSVLMRGIVQLPDYLERLQSGHKDIPIVLLPLLNDLRACRGEKLLSESVLFSPDLGAPLPAAAAGAAQPVPELELRALAARLRNNFQVGLLHWFRNTRPDEALVALIGVLDRLRGITVQEEARRLWWVAAGVLDGVRAGAIDVSPALKVLFGRVDREIKRLADVGEGAFRVDPPRELVKNLLYYVAHARSHTERTREIARTYKLEQLLPTQAELDHAKGSLAGRNRALLDTVSAAIKEDLMRVKDALDLYLRSGADARPTDLAMQTEVLDRVADTLGIMGLGVPRRVVLEQRQVLADVAAGIRAADEGTLLDVAGALLYVEASLDDNIDSLGSSAEAEAPERSALELPQAEVKRILEALMKEAAGNLAQAKQDIVAFVESPWDHAKVTQIPHLLEEVGGAMRMLQLEDPAALIAALVRFIDVELIRLKRVPTSEQMDRLADALASIEYFLEATRDQRAGRERILDVTRRSLEALGYWPLPADAVEGELAEVGGAVLEQQPVVAPAGREPAPVTSITPAAGAAPNALQPEAAPVTTATTAAAADPGWPTIDVGEEPSAELIAAIGKAEPGPMPAAVVGVEPAAAPAAATPVELTTPVTIHPGADLVDLVIGEVADEPVAPPPPALDLAGLRYAEASPVDIATAPPAEPADVAYDWVEIEEEVEEEVELPPEPAADAASASFQQVPSDDIDDEIREVFVEEVQEEINNLGRQLPLWRADPHDLERLKPIRRSFHTLKGSGRLVGAMALGEFSWKVENMLNRVLDKTIPASPAVIALLEQAVAALPQLLSALRGEGPPKANIGGIMDVADKLASGEEAWLAQPAPRRATVKVKRTKRIQVPRPAPAAVAAPAAAELTETLDVVTPIDEAPSPPSSAEFVTPAETEAVVLASDESDRTAAPVLSAVDIPVDHEMEPLGAPATEPDQAAAAVVTAPIASADDGDMAQPAPMADKLAPLAAFEQVPELDPMLLDILRSEVEGHLATVQAWIAECDRSARAQVASESLLRAVHTMHGAVSMAEVRVVDRIVGPLEGYIKRLRGSGLPPTAEGLAAIREAAGLIGRVLAVLDRPGTPVPGAGLLSERLSALRDELPEPQSEFGPFGIEPEDSEAPASTEPPAAAGDRGESALLAPSELAGGVQSEDSEALIIVEEDIALTETEPDAGGGFVETNVGDAELAAALTAISALDAADSERATSGELDAAGFDEILDDVAAPESASADVVEAVSVDAPESGEVPMGAGTAAPQQAEASAGDAVVELPVATAQAAAETARLVPEAPHLHTPAPREAADAAGASAAPAAAAAAALRLLDDVYPDGALELVDVDPELIEIFVEEGNDLLDKSDALLARLREAPTERDPVVGLQRNLHTLKGNARAVGLVGIGELSHAMESLLEQSANGDQPLGREVIGLYERAFDRLHEMVGRVARRQAIGVPLRLIERFERLVAGEALASDAVATAPVAAPQTAEAAPAPQPAESLRPAPAVTADAAEEEPTLRTSQELIRVRSDLLDALVNFAGEVSIYRSRLEQQIGSFRFNLVELDATVLRLREQLRKLEIETEAQILSRYQREAEAAGGEVVFDPLELDRFSTLQQLSRALAESVSDLQSLQNTLEDQTRQAETLLLQQSRVSSELQEGLMRTRMVPFDSIVPFLRRLLRQTADELGRRATLRIEGAQGEMDRNLLERMKAPFEHMLRNAIAHGIETPAERRAAGKPEEGLVRIAVSREATEVVLRITDDGRGMDRDAIRAKAIERGMLRPDAQLSDRDLLGFVLEPGFSTAREITKIAGRGVGMDVVASEIKQLGGSLAIDSTRGKGTEFTIRLPFTLAVTQAILVRLADQVYALPMSSVQGVARIPREDFDRRLRQPNPVFTYAGEDYAIHELNALLGLPAHRANDDAQLPVLLSRTGDQRAAIRIDGVLGSREIVVKSVGPQISSVPGILGATIMGDGSVVMILDLAPLVRRSAALREEVHVERELEAALPGLVSEVAPKPTPVAPAPEARRAPLVMVVDDSITMRKVTSRVLERHDMEVITAKDGLDAVEKLQDRIPDLVLLDIEMPRMDGYELATYIRNDSRLRTVPIIMITSRTGEKHRQRAFEIGVDRYLGKPYQEADLLRNVEETLRLSRAVN